MSHPKGKKVKYGVVVVFMRKNDFLIYLKIFYILQYVF